MKHKFIVQNIPQLLKLFSSLHPDQVDVMSGGKNCLQVAAHQGHIAIVNYLLSIGANVNAVDKEGDSTLHYAAFGNQPEIMVRKTRFSSMLFAKIIYLFYLAGNSLAKWGKYKCIKCQSLYSTPHFSP